MASPADLAPEPTDAAGWRARALALRAAQDIPEATQAFARAAQLAPADPVIAVEHAQTCFAGGLPATPLFEHARRLAPEQRDISRQLALALAAEGRREEAEALLLDALARQPDWLEGHQALSTMRWTLGQRDRHLDSYREACRRLPRHAPLRLAWFYVLATLRDWSGAEQVLAEGEAAMGELRPFVLAHLYLACERVARERAEPLLAQTSAVRDPGVDLCRLRYYLRTGRPQDADAAAQRLCNSPSARLAWPYASVIWRLMGDARAGWLDGSPPCIQTLDLEWAPGELQALAQVLRGLHTASSPYIEQSVRGGTQTDRPLFFRHEPQIQAARRKITAAVRRYLEALPAADAAHPLLAPPRDQPVRFSGSWSVRLQPQGYHVAHTHPMGWISSALYVSLPDAAQMGPPPAGWISFGCPPPELGLDLPAYRTAEPRAGRLVLFPSTMWHSTLSFQDGERLVVAFDVALPQRPQVA
jgi:tetratricopeptide (TPR) repeat protein